LNERVGTLNAWRFFEVEFAEKAAGWSLFCVVSVPVAGWAIKATILSFCAF
jgi:hypothetical protein